VSGFASWHTQNDSQPKGPVIKGVAQTNPPLQSVALSPSQSESTSHLAVHWSVVAGVA
jgi:hypothetical protein